MIGKICEIDRCGLPATHRDAKFVREVSPGNWKTQEQVLCKFHAVQRKRLLTSRVTKLPDDRDIAMEDSHE